jgi:tripartite ATP-independent transporter DctM subunit
MAGIIGTVLTILLISFGLGLYVAVALGLTTVAAGFLFFDRPIWDFFGHIPWAVNSSSSIVVVPLYLLMGEILSRSGVTDEMYATLGKWLNKLPGGLLHTNIGASGLFAAISGSSVATATTITAVALPPLRAQGYDERLALGSLAAGGTLGILIPPSVIMIVYGIIAQASIGQLYIAGIVPGLLMMLSFMAIIFIIAKVRPGLAPPAEGGDASWRERFASLVGILPVCALIFCVLGTIYLGIATAVEAAAFGSSGAFLIALYNRRVSFSMLREVFISTAHTTGMVIFILIGAFLLQSMLAFLGLPGAVSQWVVSLGLTDLQFILLLCALYLVLGTFIESLAMVVTTLPIIIPMITALHIDLIWFGIIVVILVELSLITPPVGMNLFVLQGVRSRVSGPKPKHDGGILDLYIGVLPFVVAMIVVLGLIVAFPDIATGLVRLSYSS